MGYAADRRDTGKSNFEQRWICDVDVTNRLFHEVDGGWSDDPPLVSEARPEVPEHWETFVQEWLSLRFPLHTGPLWRARLFHSGDRDDTSIRRSGRSGTRGEAETSEQQILLCFSHAITDARNVRELCYELVLRLGALRGGCLPQEWMGRLPLLPPMEDYVRSWQTIRTNLRQSSEGNATINNTSAAQEKQKVEEE